MSFLERVKYVLLENNERDLAALDAKTAEVEKEYLTEAEIVQRLQEESKEARREKSDVQKKLMSKKELADLKIIYEFIANYPQIKAISERMRHSCELGRYAVDMIPLLDDPEIAFNEEIAYRHRLLRNSKCIK